MPLFPERRSASRLLDVAELLGVGPVRYEKKPGDPRVDAQPPAGLRSQVQPPTPTTRMPAEPQPPVNLDSLKRPEPPPANPAADAKVGKALPSLVPPPKPVRQWDEAEEIDRHVNARGAAAAKIPGQAIDKFADMLPQRGGDFVREARDVANNFSPINLDPNATPGDQAASIGSSLVGGPAAKGVALAGKGLLGILSKAGIGKLAASAPAAGQFFRWLVGAAKAERKAGRLSTKVSSELEGWAIHAAEAGPEAAQTYFNKLKPDVQQKVLDELKAVHGAYEEHLAKGAAQKPPASAGAPPKQQPKSAPDGFVVDPEVTPEPPPARVDPNEYRMYSGAGKMTANRMPKAGEPPVVPPPLPPRQYSPIAGREPSAPSGGGKAPASGESAASPGGGDYSTWQANFPFGHRFYPGASQTEADIARSIARSSGFTPFSASPNVKSLQAMGEGLAKNPMVMPNGQTVDNIDDFVKQYAALTNMRPDDVKKKIASAAVNGQTLETLVRRPEQVGKAAGTINKYGVPTAGETPIIGAGLAGLGTAALYKFPEVFSDAAAAGARKVNEAAQNARGPADERIPGVGGIAAGSIDEAISSLESQILQRKKANKNWERNPDSVEEINRLEAALEAAKAHKAGKR